MDRAAWDATMAVNSRIREGLPVTPSLITDAEIGMAVSMLQGPEYEMYNWVGIQGVLRRHLNTAVPLPRPMDPDYHHHPLVQMLEEAAFHLQTRLSGPEVIQVCYLALAGVLADFFPPSAEMGGKGPDGTGPKAGEAGDAAAIPKSYVSHQPQVPSRPPTDRILQSPSSSREEFLCLYPGCGKKASRQADLERHRTIAHPPKDSDLPKFHRDDQRPSRQTTPSGHQGHFRDHLRMVRNGLRNLHNEDVARRRAEDEERRALVVGWWECNRCFLRVVQSKQGWLCPGCGNRCEKEWQELRVY